MTITKFPCSMSNCTVEIASAARTDHRLLIIRGVDQCERGGARISPATARLLIDALEPIAAPKVAKPNYGMADFTTKVPAGYATIAGFLFGHSSAERALSQEASDAGKALVAQLRRDGEPMVRVKAPKAVRDLWEGKVDEVFAYPVEMLRAHFGMTPRPASHEAIGAAIMAAPGIEGRSMGAIFRQAINAPATPVPVPFKTGDRVVLLTTNLTIRPGSVGTISHPSTQHPGTFWVDFPTHLNAISRRRLMADQIRHA